MKALYRLKIIVHFRGRLSKGGLCFQPGVLSPLFWRNKRCFERRGVAATGGGARPRCPWPVGPGRRDLLAGPKRLLCRCTYLLLRLLGKRCSHHRCGASARRWRSGGEGGAYQRSVGGVPYRHVVPQLRSFRFLTGCGCGVETRL